MADTKLVDLPSLSALADADSMYVVDASDTTDSPEGSSKQVTCAVIKEYVESVTVGLLDLKGNLDASANPNYPAASKGDAYVVTVAGRVGGGSGTVVAVGDTVIAKADNAGGTQASVGTSWFVVQANTDFTNVTISGGLLMELQLV